MQRHLRRPLIIVALCLLAFPLMSRSVTPAPAPDGEPLAEILCVATLPATSLPRGDAYVDFYRTTLPAGTAIGFPADFLVPSAGLDCLESGAYTMQSDGPLAIYRGGAGEPEMIAPGASNTIETGDAVLILDNDHPQQYSVVGSEPAVVVSAMFLSTEPPDCLPGSCPANPPGASVEVLGGLPATTWETLNLAEQDLRLMVRKVMLKPGETMPDSTGNAPALRFVEAGELTWAVDRDGDGAADSELTISEGSAIPYFPPEPGRTVTLRNDTGNPVMLTELSITPIER